MSSNPSLPADRRIGRVRLRVRDLARETMFYRDVLGMEASVTTPERAVLGAPGQTQPLVILETDSTGEPLPAAAGLYHFALLLPDRAQLGAALLHLRDLGTPLQGFADHLVSEAVYLADSGGNGIEIYADRPRSRWERHDGEIRMATLPPDLPDLLGRAATWQGMPPATRMGHIHLHVTDLRRAEEFYAGLLGFEVTARSYPGALFLAANGYHHHIGVNTWAAGRPARTPRQTGLVDFLIVLPDRSEQERVAGKLRDAGQTLEECAEGWVVRDPDGIKIILGSGS